MDFIIDFILHIDVHMVNIVQQYHMWTYAILFLVIFCDPCCLWREPSPRSPICRWR